MTTPTATENGKATAIVSYLSFLGWLIAYFALHVPNKTSLGSFHLRQTLLLMLCGIGLQIISMILIFIMPFLALILWVVWIGLLVLWIIGLIAAINGEEKPMPVIGEKAQEIFRNI
jgi:uncharacterized membrane protein